jgi:hypothetical protein
MAVRGYPVGNARAMLGEIVPTGTYAGYFSGQQASLTAGTASGAYVWSDVKSSAFAVIPPTDVNIEGGDKIVATVSFNGGKLSPFDVTGSSIDTTLADLVGGSTTSTTNSQATIFGYNTFRTSPRIMWFASQQMFETSDGFTYFITRIVPRASVSYRPGGMAFRGASDATLHINSIVTQKFYNGQSYGTSGLNLNFEADSSDFVDVVTAEPVHFMAFNQDSVGPTTTFTTVYKPTSSVITLNATMNAFAVGGVPTALSSLNTTTGLATLAAAGTTNVRDTLMYATAWVPV